MKVLALTFGDRTSASSLYRVYQYREALARLQIELEAEPAAEFRNWDRLGDYDVVLIQKKLWRTGRVFAIRRRARRLIYDTDDAVWEPHDRPHHWLTRWRTHWRLRQVARASDGCTAANQVLAQELRKHARRVEIIPMALDESIWRPPLEIRQGPVRCGWAGAPVNFRYLAAIEPALLALQQAEPSVEIVVYCGRPPEFSRGLKVTHVPYQPGAEAEVLRSFDIGLLPLPDNRFAQAKSPIKGLQYLACGVATVASPVGATQEMFRDGATGIFATRESDWTAALLRLVRETGLRERIGRAAAAEFSARYTCTRVAALLAGVLRSTGR